MLHSHLPLDRDMFHASPRLRIIDTDIDRSDARFNISARVSKDVQYAMVEICRYETFMATGGTARAAPVETGD